MRTPSHLLLEPLQNVMSGIDLILRKFVERFAKFAPRVSLEEEERESTPPPQDLEEAAQKAELATVE